MSDHTPWSEITRKSRDPDTDPERTPMMIEAGLVWVWLAGEDPPCWEMRGTGLLRDHELNRTTEFQFFDHPASTRRSTDDHR